MNNRKEYILPNGKKAVFEYDVCGIGKVTLECMDELMGMISDRQQGEWIYCEDYVGHDGYKCSECGFFVPWCYDVYADSNFIRHYHTCPHCDSRMKGVDDEIATV